MTNLLPLSEDQVYKYLQNHLKPGIMLVIGSGLSCAEGLPSMGQLADHLAKASVPGNIKSDYWDSIIKEIEEHGLEAALHKIQPSEEALDFIRTEVASLILAKEKDIVSRVFSENYELRLSRLFPHLPHDSRVHIVTTNYDRLIELAAESADFKVDTKAFGLYKAKIGGKHPYAYCDNVERMPKANRKVERKVVSLHKPHGSFDWFLVNGEPIRSGFDLGSNKSLIIPPGKDKYRAGYDQPFDIHREAANGAIDHCKALLIIGYGFNDDHLETHLKAKIESGIPCAILSRSLTQNAKKLVEKHPAIMALSSCDENPDNTCVNFNNQILEIPNKKIWDIAEFAKDVMKS